MADWVKILKDYVDTLETIVGTEGGIALANKLTAARALLLDQITALRMAELDPANIPADIDLIKGYTDTLEAAIGAIEGDTALHNKLTAARAGYLDNLIGVVTTGTFSLVNNTLEQDALIIAAATQLVDIELDMINLTQNNTVREYVQVDGATYRQISAKIFPTDFDTGTKAVILSFPQKNSLYKVTLQAAVAEGAARDVPFRHIRRDLV